MKIGKESEKLEFKMSGAELKEGIISIVAMLNKHGGGELYFGIRNDGTPVGMDIAEKTLRDISQAIDNRIEPKIYPQINVVYVDEKSCVHITFSGDDAPYFAYGRVYIRVADEDRVLSSAELKDFILKKNAWRIVWDSELSDKTISDVDDAVIKDYIERANSVGRIDFAYTTKEEVLNKLGLIENGKLKNAAYLLFVGSNMLEIQMAIFAGTERLTFNDIKRESGSVAQLVKVAEKYIRNNIRWRVVLDGSIKRKEIPEIPIDAIREALVNSYCHRLYTSSQNNEITIHSNRIEIYNPGTFPEGLTPQDFIDGNERSIKRNPLLAQLMYYTKDIESFGTGLKRIANACDDAGVKVEFKLLKKGFAVIFYRPDEFLTTDKNGDVVRNVVRNVVINKTEQAVLMVVSNNSELTADEIAKAISKSSRTVQRHLESLQKKNLVRRVGSTKAGTWEVIDNVDIGDEQ
ncbi:MAG: putative DNA binding domain-containing protein [Christensenellaceae bacterium]|jgi:ATP-dependent DNA helicase RecG|nr:putative DNA binding domain-containing protein [Christensenellaceae bacterium]